MAQWSELPHGRAVVCTLPAWRCRAWSRCSPNKNHVGVMLVMALCSPAVAMKSRNTGENGVALRSPSTSTLFSRAIWAAGLGLSRLTLYHRARWVCWAEILMVMGSGVNSQ